MSTISVDRVFQAVQSLVNKDQRSSLKPAEFNSFAAIVMSDIYDDIRVTIKNDTYGMVSGAVDMERLQYSQEALDELLVPALVTSKSGDTYPRPADIESLGGIFFNDTLIEELESYYHLTLLRRLGKHLSPDEEDADVNYYFLRSETGYQIYPEVFAEDVVISYSRKWKVPKWTYTVVLNTPVFNLSANDVQDFELPERFFDDLVFKIALMAGVNLRDMTLLDPLMKGEKQEDQERAS